MVQHERGPSGRPGSCAQSTDNGAGHTRFSQCPVPDGIDQQPLRAEVTTIERANLRTLHIPYLESTYGGDVPVREDDKGNKVPERSVFRLTLNLTEDLETSHRVLRGVANIEGQPTSLASRIYRRIAAVLIRESGF